MELTPGQLRKFPNATEDCWDALVSDIHCLTGFDGKGNGYCSGHAVAALLAVMNDEDGCS